MRDSKPFSFFARALFVFAVSASALQVPTASASVTASRGLTIQSIDDSGRHQGDIKFTIDSYQNTQIEICPSKEVMPSSSGCIAVGTFNKFDVLNLLAKVRDTAVLKRQIKIGMNLALVSVAVFLGISNPPFALSAIALGSVPAITCVHASGDLQGSERCSRAILQGLAELETLRPGNSITIRAQADFPEFVRTFKKIIPKLQKNLQ